MCGRKAVEAGEAVVQLEQVVLSWPRGLPDDVSASRPDLPPDAWLTCMIAAWLRAYA